MREPVNQNSGVSPGDRPDSETAVEETWGAMVDAINEMLPVLMEVFSPLIEVFYQLAKELKDARFEPEPEPTNQVFAASVIRDLVNELDRQSYEDGKVFDENDTPPNLHEKGISFERNRIVGKLRRIIDSLDPEETTVSEPKPKPAVDALRELREWLQLRLTMFENDTTEYARGARNERAAVATYVNEFIEELRNDTDNDDS